MDALGCAWAPAPLAKGGGANKQGPKIIEVEDPVTKKKKKVTVNNDPQRRDI